MFKRIKKRREDAGEIDTAALADIAFLLLIFFLVATTIDIDTGIGLVLPPPPNPNQKPPPIKDRNLLKILVNNQGMILIEEEPAALSEVKQKVHNFVTNNGQEPNLSVSPQKAVVSIKTDRQTPYEIYIDMLDEVKGAYNEIRNQASLAQFGKNYDQLNKQQQSVIQKKYPQKISIAEPEGGS